MIALVLLALAALLTGGCVASNMADYVRALGSDPATVGIKLTLSTPWGTQVTTGARTAMTNGTVSCPQDGGMSVRSGTVMPEPVQSVKVPLDVKPQQLGPGKP